MITRKKYDLEFKQKIGMEIAAGVSTAGAISKREGISSNTIYKWRDKYAGGPISLEESETWELKRQIRDLEETVSEQALQIHILKKTQKIIAQLKKKENLSGAISPLTLGSKKAARR